jgi:hypothetical protein
MFSNPNVTLEKKYSLHQLFNKIAFFTAAGFSLEGDKAGVRKILELAWSVGHFRLCLTLIVLSILPAPILNIAKQFRHKRIDINVLK